MLDAYLQELERELSRRLPREDVQARLAEAETHLRDGVEGRLELGMEPEAAERDAVVTFGDARTIARRSAHAALARYDAWRMGWYGAWWVSMGAVVRFTSFSAAFDMAYSDFFCMLAVLGSLIGLAVAAFASRRPATLRIAALTPVLGLAFAALLCGTWLRAEGSAYGAYRRSDLGRTLADYRRLDRAGAAFERSGVEALKAPGGYLTFDGRRQRADNAEADWYFEMDLRPARDRKEAGEAWANVDLRHLRNEIAALERAERNPWGDAVGWMTRSTIPILTPTSFLFVPLLVDLVFGTLGAVAFTVRRRFDRGTYA